MRTPTFDKESSTNRSEGLSKSVDMKFYRDKPHKVIETLKKSGITIDRYLRKLFSKLVSKKQTNSQ